MGCILNKLYYIENECRCLFNVCVVLERIKGLNYIIFNSEELIWGLSLVRKVKEN